MERAALVNKDRMNGNTDYQENGSSCAVDSSDLVTHCNGNLEWENKPDEVFLNTFTQITFADARLYAQSQSYNRTFTVHAELLPRRIGMKKATDRSVHACTLHSHYIAANTWWDWWVITKKGCLDIYE